MHVKRIRNSRFEKKENYADLYKIFRFKQFNDFSFAGNLYKCHNINTADILLNFGQSL